MFVDIAEALEMQADALLYDNSRESVSQSLNELSKLFEGCDAKQARIITEIAKATKQSLDAHL